MKAFAKVKNTHTKGVVFGLSGGMDSALVAALSANALKKNVLGLIMPESKSSPKNDMDDAVMLAKKIKYKIIKLTRLNRN